MEFPEASRVAARVFGYPDGKQILAAMLEGGFDPYDYRDGSADLLRTIAEPDLAFVHFLRHGIRERRQFSIQLSPTPLLDMFGIEMSQPEFRNELMAALTNAYAGRIQKSPQPTVSVRLSALGALRPKGCRPFLIIGDSHSSLYRRSPTLPVGYGWLTPLHILCTGGSAIGLSNPHSLSGYRAQIETVVSERANQSASHRIPIFFQFGQVDVEFVYNFRRVRSRSYSFEYSSFRSFVTESVENYVGFLASLFARSERASAFILSLFPPSLSDDKWAEGYVNAQIAALEAPELFASDLASLSKEVRKLEIPNLQARSDMHALYNTCLQEACSHYGFNYVDGFTPFLSPNRTILDDIFIPIKKGSDHHLEYAATASIIENILLSVPF
jgi:hypothetical protein